MAYVKTAISLQETRLQKMDDMARQLDISRSRLFVLAAEDYLQRYQNQELLEAINAAYDDLPDALEETQQQHRRHQHRQDGKRSMVIKQGDVFWVELGEPAGSEPGYRHPHVVIQNNVFNQSHINTVFDGLQYLTN